MEAIWPNYKKKIKWKERLKNINREKRLKRRKSNFKLYIYRCFPYLPIGDSNNIAIIVVIMCVVAVMASVNRRHHNSYCGFAALFRVMTIAFQFIYIICLFRLCAVCVLCGIVWSRYCNFLYLFIVAGCVLSVCFVCSLCSVLWRKMISIFSLFHSLTHTRTETEECSGFVVWFCLACSDCCPKWLFNAFPPYFTAFIRYMYTLFRRIYMKCRSKLYYNCLIIWQLCVHYCVCFASKFLWFNLCRIFVSLVLFLTRLSSDISCLICHLHCSAIKCPHAKQT